MNKSRSRGLLTTTLFHEQQVIGWQNNASHIVT